MRPETGFVERLVLLVEFLDRPLPAPEYLHERVPGVHLLDVAVEGAGPCPLGRELLLRSPRDEQGHHDRQRHGNQRDRRQQRADPDHHGEHANDG